MGMHPRAKLGEESVPTHCMYSGCQEGPDGGPAPLEQTPGKRTRSYCSNPHRALAWQETTRRGRVVALPTPPARQVVYGDDVLAVHRDFRASLEGLKTLAEQLAQVLVPTGDVRAAKALIDQAESALAAREREGIAALGAEIEARIAAVDRAESADEEAEAARRLAEQARVGQLDAEAQLTAAREVLERERVALRDDVERIRRESEEAVAAANTRASAAAAAHELAAAAARDEIARIHATSDAATREARELAARADGAREAALVELKSAHEDARRAREETERVRGQLERQITEERERAEVRVKEVRDSADARIGALEREAVARVGALQRELDTAREREQQMRIDAQLAAKELVRQRESRELELAEEKARGAARVEEVRAGLSAQLVLVQKIADDRALERDRLAQQLEEARTTHAESRKGASAAQKEGQSK